MEAAGITSMRQPVTVNRVVSHDTEILYGKLYGFSETGQFG